ncbi:carbon monoxide dehydrogenase, partial [Modestobacter sp. VKM Ac-2676]
MIPSPFEYVKVRSVEEALAALAEHGEDAKLMAGGHSLLPIMKLRLSVPTALVDISGIPDLSYVRV